MQIILQTLVTFLGRFANRCGIQLEARAPYFTPNVDAVERVLFETFGKSHRMF